MKARLLPALAALTVLAAAAATAQSAKTGEWPQWRGPNRDGVSRETGLLKTWPAGGPRLLWKANGTGGGYGTPSVAGGKVYGMGYRAQEEVVWALDAQTGKEVWASPVAAANRRGKGYGDGSRSTPTVDGNRVYALGDSGDLVCLDANTGAVAWKKDLVAEFAGGVPGWGYTESPLVDGNKLIVTPGGRNATLVALNKQSGELIWSAKVPDGNGAQYSSAIVAEPEGRRQYIQFLSGGVVGIAAADGKLLWRYTSPANGTANISTPIYRDGMVFAASGYNTGGGLARLMAGPEGVSASEVYFTKNMQNHHGGMVLVGDYLYGFDRSSLTCLNFKTGEVAWADRSVGKGSVVYADGHLYCRSERGPIALVEANPARYVEKGRFDQPDRSGKDAWPHPVVAGGRLYIRDQDVLLCYEVKNP